MAPSPGITEEALSAIAQTITDPGLGDDAARARRLIAELLPQVTDHYAQGTQLNLSA